MLIHSRVGRLIRDMFNGPVALKSKAAVIDALSLSFPKRYARYVEARRRYMQLEFLHADYASSFYFWEVFEIIFKTTLLSLPLLMSFALPYANLDLIIGVSIAFGFCVFVSRNWPRRRRRDNIFAIMCLVVTYATLFVLTIVDLGEVWRSLLFG